MVVTLDFVPQTDGFVRDAPPGGGLRFLRSGAGVEWRLTGAFSRGVWSSCLVLGAVSWQRPPPSTL